MTAPQRYRILHTGPEEAFDRLAQTAAQRLDAPLAAIVFRTDNRSWTKASWGIDRDSVALNDALYDATQEADGVFVVTDEPTDGQPSSTAASLPDAIRFYAGVSLHDPDGAPIGVLCIMDTRPRSPSDDALTAFRVLADLCTVERELRLDPDAKTPSQSTNVPSDSNAANRKSYIGSLIDDSPHPVLVLDAETLRIQRANESAVRSLGSDPDTLDGRSLPDLVTTDPDEIVRQLQPLYEGTATQVLLKVAGRDVVGGVAQLYLLVLAVGGTNSDVFWALGLHFAERFQMDAAMRQRNNIEAVRRLVRGLAHNFNNILHATTLYLQLAREDVDAGPTVEAYLERTEEGLHEAADLVSKLQTFSQPYGKGIEQRVDLEDVVADARSIVAPSVPEHVELTVQADPECVVQGDPVQLREVLIHLLTNSLEAIGEDERPNQIDVTVRRIEVDPSMAASHLQLAPGPHVRLAVRDTGSGMDPGMVPHIVEPFYTTKRGPRVAGLGLSIAHTIVQSHGSQMDVETELGGGTTVYVYLPRADTASATETDEMESV